MIIYGTRATNLRNGQIINVDCPGCETNTSMKYSVFGKYGHVYWIPFFPMKKITVAECNSCKKTYEYNELSDSIKTKLQREKEKGSVRFPVWMFSGIFIILGLIGFGFYDSQKTDLNTAEYVKNPKAGDVYFLKISEGHYTSARVDKVSRTEVYLTNNDYEIDLESDKDKLDEPKNYTSSKDTVTFFDIQQSFKKKTIIEVKRN
jgi:hypothetical protein